MDYHANQTSQAFPEFLPLSIKLRVDVSQKISTTHAQEYVIQMRKLSSYDELRDQIVLSPTGCLWKPTGRLWEPIGLLQNRS